MKMETRTPPRYQHNAPASSDGESKGSRGLGVQWHGNKGIGLVSNNKTKKGTGRVPRGKTERRGIRIQGPTWKLVGWCPAIDPCLQKGCAYPRGQWSGASGGGGCGVQRVSKHRPMPTPGPENPFSRHKRAVLRVSLARCTWQTEQCPAGPPSSGTNPKRVAWHRTRRRQTQNQEEEQEKPEKKTKRNEIRFLERILQFFWHIFSLSILPRTCP